MSNTKLLPITAVLFASLQIFLPGCAVLGDSGKIVAKHHLNKAIENSPKIVAIDRWRIEHEDEFSRQDKKTEQFLFLLNDMAKQMDKRMRAIEKDLHKNTLDLSGMGNRLDRIEFKLDTIVRIREVPQIKRPKKKIVSARRRRWDLLRR